jgi:hypothetical protein
VAQGDSNAARSAVEKLKRWQKDKANRKALPNVSLVKLFAEDLTNRYQQLFTETILAKSNDTLDEADDRKN